MKALSRDLQVTLLESLIRDWNAAVSQPATARVLILRHSAFADSFIQELVGELVLCGGDWRQAVATVKNVNWRAANKTRLVKFANWAERLTSARPVRGLLTWNGGAS